MERCLIDNCRNPSWIIKLFRGIKREPINGLGKLIKVEAWVYK